MAEYIEREALINELLSNAFTDDLYGMGLTRGIEISVATAKRINASDVAPVRHGRWNADETCPFCGKKSTEGLDAEKWNYWFPDFCPNCGAKMDGGDGNA